MNFMDSLEVIQVGEEQLFIDKNTREEYAKAAPFRGGYQLWRNKKVVADITANLSSYGWGGGVIIKYFPPGGSTPLVLSDTSFEQAFRTVILTLNPNSELSDDEEEFIEKLKVPDDVKKLIKVWAVSHGSEFRTWMDDVAEEESEQ